MRCRGLVKVWNPDFIKYTGKEPFKGRMWIWLQCPTTTKITSAKCWKLWYLCGLHAAISHPEEYPKGSAPRKGGGRYGNSINPIPFNQVVPMRVRKKSNKKILTHTTQ